MMDDDARGSGRTTLQMLGAPRNAMFVWVNDTLAIPRYLARKHDREDLRIEGPRILERPLRLRGLEISAIILDHAVHLTALQEKGLKMISPYVGRK